VLSCFEIEAWISSEMKAISPLVDRLMRLVEASHCVPGYEFYVELAFQEALNKESFTATVSNLSSWFKFVVAVKWGKESRS
jgi:hypothetical protein